ncbi:BspA family leucine-rich repeat surface protein [Cochleicola gelatinilyticus]|nr:BspA family leucine-rich repeat surface protein [Cochleicola gelatinilyticus]
MNRKIPLFIFFLLVTINCLQAHTLENTFPLTNAVSKSISSVNRPLLYCDANTYKSVSNTNFTPLAGEFETIWNTSLPGPSLDTDITIPTNPAFSYNYSIDWGDGTNDTNVTGDISHSYASPGIYTVKISGTFPAIYFNIAGDRQKIIEITSWGMIEWQSMENAFFGCTNLNFDAIDSPNLSQVTSLKNMFRNTNLFNGILNNWNVSTITDISGMFMNANTFNRPLDNWNTGNVTDMSDTFNNAQNFNEPLDNWNTGSVTSMARMFRFAFDFNQNINTWNVGNVTDMEEMFYLGLNFNTPLNSWDVSNVENMSEMFSNSQFMQPLDSWDVGNVIDMSSMFAYCPFNQPIGNWDVSKVTDMSRMFAGNYAFNQPINPWDVSSVITMQEMFMGSTSTLTIFNQPLDQWDVGAVENMQGMFRSSSFNQPINNWTVSNVTTMEDMFNRALNFNQSLSSWDVSNVTSSADMFNNASVFDQPLNTWNVASVIDMQGMFRNASAFNQSLNTWDVSSVTRMDMMFSSASVFNQNLGIWTVENVSNMTNMLDNSGLSEENYNNTLIGWASQNLQNNVVLGADTLLYCDGRFARQDIIDTYNWSINDDIINCDFVLCTPFISPIDGDTNVPADFNLVWEEVPVATGYRLTVTKDTGGTVTTVVDNVNVGNITVYDFPTDFAPGDIVTALVIPFNSEGPAENCETISFTIVAPWHSSPESFKLTYDTSIVYGGSSSTNQLEINVNSNFTYDFSIDWGDGQFNNNVSSDIRHTYDAPGIYTIAIIGTYPTHSDGYNTSDYRKLLTIDQWGTIAWQSMLRSFIRCENMTYNATDIPDLSQVTNMSEMFRQAEMFNGSINSWVVSNVTNMSGMFSEAESFNQPLNEWDVSNVTDISYMFERALLFNQPLSDWDVSNVTSMENTFDGFIFDMAFNQPLNSWNVSNVTNMAYMFRRNVDFNQPLNTWQVANVTDMNNMFNASGFNQNIENWNVSNVTNMGAMFSSAQSFDQPLAEWDTSNVTNMSSMFNNTTNFNQPIDNWDVSSVLYMNNMFRNAQSFNQPLNSWDVSSVINTSAMFQSTVLFNQNINSWNVSRVTNMKSMFESAENFDQPLSDWDVNSVVDMSSMFENAQVFNQPIQDWNVSAVATMASMFQDAQLFDQPIGNWDVSSVTLMNSMFEDAQVFNQNINPWNVASVTTMQEMFKNAAVYNQPLESWNTGEVLTTEEMFRGASLFNQNIEPWNVSFVTTTEGMFQEATAFNQPLNSWNIASVTTTERMFKGAIVFDQFINDWNTRGITTMEEMFDRAQQFNQPLENWRVADVQNMNRMFRDAASFNQDLNAWNIGNVSMRAMFQNTDTYDQYLGDWNISQVSDMANMLDNSALSRTNYDNTLIAWSEQSLTSGITLGAFGVPYCDALEERQSMIDAFGWNIVGDVLDCPIPECTQLISPLDGAIDVPVNTNLTWEPTLFARGYRLTVRVDPGNITIVNNETIINETSYEFATDFSGGETVYVTITPFNGSGDALPCPEESFIIVDDATPTLPECTNLTTPLDGETDVVINTDLSWNPIANADGYRINIGISPSGTQIENNVDVGNVTTYDLPNDLPENTTIYVTVIPYNEVGSALNCAEETFITETIPTPPECTTLTNPLDGAVDVPITTDLSWNPVPNATGYLLIVGTTSGGNEIVTNLDVGNVTTYDIPVDLPENRLIYVTIIPYNDIGDATECAEESFRTEIPSNVIALCTDYSADLDANGTVTIQPEDVDGGSSDPDGPVTLSLDTDTFTCENIGDNTVILSVTDTDGNTATCTAVVTIRDTIAPEIVCPENQIGSIDSTCLFTIPDYTLEATATDNCAMPIIVQDPVPGSTVGAGITVITITATDGTNTSSCSFTLDVDGTSFPEITCPEDQTGTLNDACEFIVPDYTSLATASNTCDGTVPTLSQDPAPGTSIASETTITLTATDPDGDTSTCSFQVTVMDVIAPQISCPPLQDESAGTNCMFSIPDYTPLANAVDNCGSTTLTQTPAIGTQVGLGTTEITLTASDGTNQSTCTFTIEVHDTTPPIASCVAPFSVSLDADGVATISASDIHNNSTDNCELATVSIDITEFNCDSVGENTITLTATDSSGNTSICTTIVTVEDPLFACNEPPVAICEPIVTSADENCVATASAEDFNNGSYDPEGASLTYSILPEGPYGLGITQVTLTVSDGVETASCETTITVNDTTPPTITCPEDQNETAATDCSFILPDYTSLAVATDNCGISEISQVPAPGTILSVGTTEILLIANDGSNSSQCTFNLIITDATPPVASCQDIFITLDATGEATVDAAQIDNGSYDSCSAITMELDQTVFDCSTIGENTVVLTVTDASGNSTTCEATVTVEDTTPPILVCTNTTLFLDEFGNAILSETDVITTLEDNCSIGSTSISPTQFTCENIGDNEVLIITQDANGNATECTAIVTVLDEVPPTVFCSNITIELDALGTASITATDLDATSSDNCEIAELTIDTTTFSCDDLGENSVVLTGIDTSGNTSQCTATVTVIDTILPQAVCQNISVALDQNGSATIDAFQIDGGSTDNCEIAAIEINQNNFGCDDIGENEVVFTVTDASGNTSTCTAIVTVTQTTATPQAICQNITVFLNDSGIATITPNDLNNGSVFNACESTMSVNIDTFNCSDIGNPVPVMFTVSNGNGNSDSCIAMVEVIDAMAPSIQCPSESLVIYGVEPFPLPNMIVDSMITITDNCTPSEFMTVTQSPPVGTNLQLGELPVTITITDAYGNETTCDVTVDLQRPPLNISLDALRIDPNPADEFIWLRNPNNVSLEGAKLFDVHGRLLREYDLSSVLTDQRMSISGLAGATYFLVVTNGALNVTFSVVKY